MYPKLAAEEREERISIIKNGRLLDEEQDIIQDDQEEDDVQEEDLTPWTDFVLATYSFSIIIAPDVVFTAVEAENTVVKLKFPEIGNQMLSPWEIKPGKRLKYQLPKL